MRKAEKKSSDTQICYIFFSVLISNLRVCEISHNYLNETRGNVSLVEQLVTWQRILIRHCFLVRGHKPCRLGITGLIFNIALYFQAYHIYIYFYVNSGFKSSPLKRSLNLQKQKPCWLRREATTNSSPHCRENITKTQLNHKMNKYTLRSKLVCSLDVMNLLKSWFPDLSQPLTRASAHITLSN